MYNRHTGINSRAGIVQLKLIITKLNLLELDLPVRLATYGNIVELARESTGVNASKDRLTTILLGRTKTEGENRFIEKALLDHLVEGRGNTIHGDGVVRETKDTIEPSVD